MSSADKNLSDVHISGISKADAAFWKIAIIRSEWNTEITEALQDGCIRFLLEQGLAQKKISTYTVPGSFELIYAAANLLEKRNVDAIICLGCIVKGETPHFDYIAQAVSIGIATLNTKGKTPIIFGVLTTDNLKQAKDRAGGKHGNKGIEAAAAALQMITFSKIKK
jgi:6,7-dimethyl-8-ribityllumazine synthase